MDFFELIVVWLLYFTGFGYHLYLNTSLCIDPNDTLGNGYDSQYVQFIACRPKGLCQVKNQEGKIVAGVGLGCHVDGHCATYDPILNTPNGGKIDSRGFEAAWEPDPPTATPSVRQGVCVDKYSNLFLGRLTFAFETSTAGSWVPELFMFSSFQANEAWIYTSMLLASISGK